MKEPQCCFCFVVVNVGSEKNIDLRVPSFRYVSIAHIYMGQYWSQILSVLVTVNDVPNERLHIDEQHLKGNREIAVSTRNKWKALIHRFFVHVTQTNTHSNVSGRFFAIQTEANVQSVWWQSPKVYMCLYIVKSMRQLHFMCIFKSDVHFGFCCSHCVCGVHWWLYVWLNCLYKRHIYYYYYFHI